MYLYEVIHMVQSLSYFEYFEREATENPKNTNLSLFCNKQYSKC